MLPDLGYGRIPDEMYAQGGSLFQLDEDGEKGLYQIQFYLTYYQGGI